MHNKENLSLAAVQRHGSAARDISSQADASSEAEWWLTEKRSVAGMVGFISRRVWCEGGEWGVAWKLAPLSCEYRHIV